MADIGNQRIQEPEMNKLIALCCLMLAAPQFGLAQTKDTTQKPAPMTKRELAEKEKATHLRMGQCSDRAQNSGYKAGTEMHRKFMSDCLKG
jgi:hypothetical protein